MKMKLLTEKIFDVPFYTIEGDSLIVTYNGVKLSSIPITNPSIIDKISIFEISDEHNFESGYCVILGKSKE